MDRNAKPRTDERRALVGARVREERRARGINQAELARRTGISVHVLSLVERGERGVNSIQLRRIAEALGIGLDELFEPARIAPDNATSEMVEFGRSLIRDMKFVETCRD